MGLITNIDANGRIQLPLAIRCRRHLQPGDKIAMDHLGDGTITLKKIEEQKTMAAAEMPEIGMAQHTTKVRVNTMKNSITLGLIFMLFALQLVCRTFTAWR